MGFVLFVVLKMKGAIIMLAKIINNIPYCKKCGCIASENGKDYRQVVDEEGNQYTEFIKYCSNTHCHNLVIYQVEVNVDDEHKRYALANVKPYKDE